MEVETFNKLIQIQAEIKIIVMKGGMDHITCQKVSEDIMDEILISGIVKKKYVDAYQETF